MTSAPAPASAAATARPIPRRAPVTRAVRPVRSNRSRVMLRSRRSPPMEVQPAAYPIRRGNAQPARTDPRSVVGSVDAPAGLLVRRFRPRLRFGVVWALGVLLAAAVTVL